MKILKTGAFCVSFSLCFLGSSAQKDQIPVNEPDYNKPKLFADLPDSINLETSAMEALLQLPLGTRVNAKAIDRLPFNGTVISKAEDKAFKSIVVRLANRYGATLTFSKTANGDGSFTYVGRIISLKHGDAYEIVQERGHLVLKKKGLYELFSE